MRRLWPFVIIVTSAVLFSAAFLIITSPSFVGLGPAPGLRDVLFRITGEERFASQLLGLVQWAFRWTRPMPDVADDVPIAYTDLPPFGVNTFLEQEVEPEKRARSLEMIAEAGFYWIRQSFPWYDIEIHGKGDFEDRRHEPYRSAWDKYDNIVDLAEQSDLEIIARLEAPPAWSRQDGTLRGAFGPPDNLEDYGDYVAAVVSRYKGRIRFYQIWNEPNIYPEWGNQPVDPKAYTALLCLAAQRARAVDPDVVIISGAMAPTVELGTWNPTYEGNNLMDVIFLQRMYDAGAGECFDVMAVNDYMLWSGPEDHRLRPTNVDFSRPLWVRDVMVANGDAYKPIWISEMNSNAAPEGIEPRYGRVSLEQQARYAPLAYTRIQREWPWVGVATIWFFKRASDAERDQPMYYFRLVEPDFTPLPVYANLAEYLTTLTPVLYRGHHQESTWQLGYEGDWHVITDEETVSGTYRSTTDLGASLRLSWVGRSLVLVPGPNDGLLRLAFEDGTSREVVLHGSPVTLSRHLRPRQQTLKLELVSGEFSIDGIRVR